MKRIIVTLISIMMLFSAALCSEAIVYAVPSPVVVAATRQSVKTGWKKESGKWYYYNAAGTKVKYLNKINGKYYYFNGTGVMQTGWITFKEGKRYFNSDGSMAVGWKTINKRQYFFKSCGLMAVYINTIDGKTYYFNGSGVMQKGWLKFNNGKWRYYNTNGVMATGWQTLNAKKYYFGYDGYMYTYTNKIGSNTYYFNSKGVMHTGWLSFNNGKKRYYNSNGVMWTGWQTINNKKYYFESDGYMRTETLKDEANNIQYIFNSDGSLNRTAQLHLPETGGDWDSYYTSLINDSEADKVAFAKQVRDAYVNRKTASIVIYSKKSESEIYSYFEDIANMAISEEVSNSPLTGDYLKFNAKLFSCSLADNSVYFPNNYGINKYEFIYKYKGRTTANEDKTLISEIKKLYSNNNVYSKSRYEQLEFIYQYICSNVNYELNDNNCYTAYGALFDNKAVCHGYSLLFYCMCKELNIPVRFIDASSINHAWNIVQMENGLWYNIDCTYGAPFRAGSVKYFLAGTDERDFWISNKGNADPEYETTSFKRSHPMSPTAYKAE